MRKPILISLAACSFLTSCNSPERKAEREESKLAIVKKTGDKQAICQQANKVRDAYLEAENTDKYQEAKLFADVDCLTASLDRD